MTDNESNKTPKLISISLSDCRYWVYDVRNMAAEERTRLQVENSLGGAPNCACTSKGK